MPRPLHLTLGLGLLALGHAAAAPIQVSFWHSMESASALVQRLADDFNKSQSSYQVVPTSVGNYRDAEAKLQEAIKAGKPPTLFQAELSTFPGLVAAGQVVSLNGFEKTLAPDFVGDFYPAVWNYGEVAGARYGLPWNVSTPVLYYNAGALKRAGVGAPRTWADVEAAAAKLSGRGRRGLLITNDSWSFEQLVDARGGSVVKDGKPNFTSPEVVAALDSLARLSSSRAAQPRSLDEATRAALDFVRGANLMAVASIANWTDFQKYTVFFELGAAPMPCDKTCAVPFGGAELVVLKGASPQAQVGAQAFWQYLMRPEVLNSWVRETSYMTPRKSVQARLADYYAQNPYRQAAFAQLDRAVPRPKAPQYAVWQKYLEEAILRAIQGQASAAQALADAQKKALGQ